MQSSFNLHDLIPDVPLITIVDIGALMMEGESEPYSGLVEAGRARLVGFEPDAEGCRRLNEAHGAPHRFYPHFVGDGGPATFHETSHPMTGSLYKPNEKLLMQFNTLHELTTPKAEHAVETTRLDDVEGLEDADFLKMDVQGSELPILQNAPTLLAKTTIVQAEVCFVPLYEDQPLYADVDVFLRAAGFQFHYFRTMGKRCYSPLVVGGDVNAGLRQMLWADAVYVRDPLALGDQPVEKLVKMAILLHDVFQSYDLCLLVLGEADKQAGSQLAPAYFRKLSGQ